MARLYGTITTEKPGALSTRCAERIITSSVQNLDYRAEVTLNAEGILRVTLERVASSKRQTGGRRDEVDIVYGDVGEVHAQRVALGYGHAVTGVQS